MPYFGPPTQMQPIWGKMATPFKSIRGNQLHGDVERPRIANETRFLEIDRLCTEELFVTIHNKTRKYGAFYLINPSCLTQPMISSTGKIGQVRAKAVPRKLSKEEFDIMKTHSTIGGETLKAADIEAGGDSL